MQCLLPPWLEKVVVATEAPATKSSQIIRQLHFLYVSFKVSKLIADFDYLTIRLSILKVADLLNSTLLQNEPAKSVWLSVCNLSLIETEKLIRVVK